MVLSAACCDRSRRKLALAEHGAELSTLSVFADGLRARDRF